jgi:hypothetical protein
MGRINADGEKISSLFYQHLSAVRFYDGTREEWKKGIKTDFKKYQFLIKS